MKLGKQLLPNAFLYLDETILLKDTKYSKISNQHCKSEMPRDDHLNCLI